MNIRPAENFWVVTSQTQFLRPKSDGDQSWGRSEAVKVPQAILGPGATPQSAPKIAWRHTFTQPPINPKIGLPTDFGLKN